MIRELKYSLIKEMEPIIEKLNNGYSVNLCGVVDKIHYINSITFEGVSSPMHPVIQPMYCVAEAPPDISVNLPIVTTATITDILKDSVLARAEVLSEGTAPVTIRGFCWSTSQNPIIGNVNTTANGNGLGEFSSPILGLATATTYYIKAYATNSFGTSYGNAIIISTQASIPVLTTVSFNTITRTTVKSEATIASPGGSPVTASGICWSTTVAPDIYDAKTTTGISNGAFTTTATGLLPNTVYYLRAYATNNVGTGYSSELTFTTLITEAIVATLTGSSVTSGDTFNVIQWFVSLSAPATSDIVIPCVTTNSTNTGNIIINVAFLLGQQYSAANILNYTRPTDVNFIANCAFGTMPEGYTAGPVASFTILKQ